MTGKYARGTEVAVSKTRAELEDTITRFGARSFISGNDGRMAMIAFEARDRRVVFQLEMPDPDDKAFHTTPTGRPRKQGQSERAYDAECRRRWRALFIAIKAKLISVEEGVETFEQAFLAHVVMPDGQTLGQHVAPRLATAYETGTMLPLLPGPKEDSNGG
ncbi:MAG: hypothetical protein ROR55_20755 [Devosia sp.]